MKKLLFSVALLSFFACKKNYTCNCTTLDASQQIVDQETFTVKAATLGGATSTCTKNYTNNRSSTSSGQMGCEAKP